jgi:hypothetical protein
MLICLAPSSGAVLTLISRRLRQAVINGRRTNVTADDLSILAGLISIGVVVAVLFCLFSIRRGVRQLVHLQTPSASEPDGLSTVE